MNAYNILVDYLILFKIRKIAKKTKGNPQGIILLPSNTLQKTFHFSKSVVNTSLERLYKGGYIKDTFRNGVIATHALQLTDKGIARLKSIIPTIIIEIIIFIAGMVVEYFTDIIKLIFDLLWMQWVQSSQPLPKNNEQ